MIDDNSMYWINEAALVSFTGLVVCSLFLSLQMFEIFYYIAVIVNAIVYLYGKQLAAPTDVDEPVTVNRNGKPKRNGEGRLARHGVSTIRQR